jgi:hypothetical protein
MVRSLLEGVAVSQKLLLAPTSSGECESPWLSGEWVVGLDGVVLDLNGCSVLWQEAAGDNQLRVACCSTSDVVKAWAKWTDRW